MEHHKEQPAEVREVAWAAAESEAIELGDDERENMRRVFQQEHHDAEIKRLGKELDEERKKSEDMRKRNATQRRTVRTQLEKTNRTLMLLVLAVILAAFTSLPATRELAFMIVKGLVTPK